MKKTTLKGPRSTATMICGDALAVVKDLPPDFVIISDPPYGIAYLHSGLGKGKHNKRHLRTIKGDDCDFNPRHLLRFKKVLIWGADHYSKRLPRGRFLAWDKLDGLKSWDSFPDVEFAWHNRRGAARLFRCLWKGICRRTENGQRAFVSAQKPVALMEWCLREARVKRGQTVVDPYAGSGTTGIACLRAGVDFIGVEIVPAKYRIACARLRREIKELAA